MKQEKFLKRYRIGSIRLPTWDYSSPGYYFITICTRDGKTMFGHVEDGEMILNTAGEIAHKFWLELPKRFEHVFVDQFIIMPNHMHGVLKFCYRPGCEIFDVRKCNRCRIVDCTSETVGASGETCRGMSLQNTKRELQYNQFSKPIRGSLSMVINHYKGRCTKTIRETHGNNYFGWQSGYHEKIIREDRGLKNIRKYIKNNPSKWWRDRNNSNKLWM